MTIYCISHSYLTYIDEKKEEKDWSVSKAEEVKQQGINQVKKYTASALILYCTWLFILRKDVNNIFDDFQHIGKNKVVFL